MKFFFQIQPGALQNTLHYNTLQYITMYYTAIQYITIQYNKNYLQYNIIQYNTMTLLYTVSTVYITNIFAHKCLAKMNKG